MPTPSRFYSSIAQQTTLTGSITGSSTTITVAATAGFPGSTPFTIALDYGQSNEELVDVTSVAGFSFTVTRAVDGTSATSHNAGAFVRHVSSGRDFSDSRSHEAATAAVHGVTGVGNDLVGTLSTQTLSNKTLNRATGTLERIDIFNTGTWTTSVIGDSANPSFPRLSILENEVNLRTIFTITSVGGATSVKSASESDLTYRFRAVDSDGTTDRFEVLSGGTLSVIPTATAARTAIAVRTDDVSVSRAFSVVNLAGTTSKFSVSRAGSVAITPDVASASINPLSIASPAGISVDQLSVVNSAATTQFSVQSDGKTFANRGALVTRTGQTSGTLLQVGSTNAGYTGSLQQWVSPANVVVGSVNELGQASFTASSATGSAVATANTGWSIQTAVAVAKAGIVTVVLNVTRTGADITADGAGNVGDSQIATINGNWDPSALLTEAISSPFQNGTLAGVARLNTDSTVDLITFVPGQTVQSGSPAWRMNFTYPL